MNSETSWVQCTNCRRPYPEQGLPYRCSACGGVYDFASWPGFDPALLQLPETAAGSPHRPSSKSIWRYWHVLGLPDSAPLVSLGEGGTPLVWAQAFGREVAFKLETLNPTGSYKDRGSAVLASFLLSRGVEQAVEDSSGNAGASFAAYASRAGIRARVFVPDGAAGPKRAQIAAYGAEVVRVLGPRSNAAEAVRRAADAGAVYASHAYLPHGLTGYATLAYELLEDLGQAPGTVLAPAGQGNLLLALGRGFQALAQAGLIRTLPRLVAVQARACAPLWSAFNYGPAGLGWVSEGDTLAEGVRVRYPLRGDALLQMIAASQGTIAAVDEQDILPGRDELARRGLFVEPTSAIVWSALQQTLDQAPDPVVAILTGNGLKSLL